MRTLPCRNPGPRRNRRLCAGSSSITLDNLDYDEHYSITEHFSRQLLKIIRTGAGTRWLSNLGNAVEIGCGTGGFSSAVLRHLPVDCMILTDVSVKMLHVCRDRLQRLDDLRADSVIFSTYSGTEDCFQPEVFDTCFAPPSCTTSSTFRVCWHRSSEY
jgi:hypothetical protein